MDQGTDKDGLRGRTVIPTTPEHRAHAIQLGYWVRNRGRCKNPYPFDINDPRSLTSPHEFVRGFQIASSGVKTAVEYCWTCGAKQTISKHDLRPVFDLCFRDNTSAEMCVICGSGAGVERHHWAPREFFGPDSESWPQSYLCRSHHQQWHATMNAAVPIPHETRWGGHLFPTEGQVIR